MKKLFPKLLLAGCSFLMMDAAYSVYHVAFRPTPYLSIWENSGSCVQFDPVQGYRLSTQGARFAKITSGQVEYVGYAVGNDAGFSDRDNFSPQRDPHNSAIRLAILGDSFSAGENISTNWPDRVERSAPQFACLNFSRSGAGLANWWQLIKQEIEAKSYDLDGVVFAVLEPDLHRKYTFAHHEGFLHARQARWSSWRPESWPRTLEEARPYLHSNVGLILSEEHFQQALDGQWRYRNQWHPDVVRPWKLYITSKVFSLLRQKISPVETKQEKPYPEWLPMPPVPADEKQSVPEGQKWPEGFTASQSELIADIAAYLKAKHLPTLVVRVPLREQVLEKSPIGNDLVEFAELLGARLVDGVDAFAGASQAEIRQVYWFPHDGHWNQQGSNRFAEFMIEECSAFSETF